jgi:alkylhydroperoxidase family enzyme
MAVLAGLSTDEVIDRVLVDDVAGLRDVRDELASLHDAAFGAVDSRRLELCRLRIAMLLGCSAELGYRTPGVELADETTAALANWPNDPHFDSADRAVLAFTEQWVIDVASLDDETAGAVRDYLGDGGLLDFAQAILVVEQRVRLRLVWDRLFGGA